MRKIFSACLLLLSLAIYGQNKDYVINGTIAGEGYEGKMIYLQTVSEDRSSLVKIDSALVQNNSFVLKNTSKSDEPELAILSFSEMQNTPQSLVVLESGNINVKMGMPSVIGGTIHNDECNSFIQAQEELKNKLQALVEKDNYAYMETPEGSAEYDKLLDQVRTKGFEYTKANIQNGIGEFFLFSFLEIFKPNQVLELARETRPSFKESQMGKSMITFFEEKSRFSEGAKYTDFSQPDMNGKLTALSDYVGKGKIVLVDFWASWCGPCIKEMPNVVRAYNEYKDKGFEIVGVSFDSEENAWKGAVSRLNMAWPQMSDLKGWKNGAGQIYGIKSIPFTMLLDKDGTIIATNLRGEQLVNKLKTLLD